MINILCLDKKMIFETMKKSKRWQNIILRRRRHDLQNISSRTKAFPGVVNDEAGRGRRDNDNKIIFGKTRKKHQSDMLQGIDLNHLMIRAPIKRVLGVPVRSQKDLAAALL